MKKLPLSKGALTLTVYVVYVIFLILVGYGWWELIVRWNSEPQYLFVQIIMVGLLMALASLAIRAVATLRAEPPADGRKPSAFRGLQYWLFAALITAIGTVSGAFNWLESRAILRDDIATVQGHYDTLVKQAGSVLGSNAYRQEKQLLDAHLKELEGEINEATGTLCGFGRKAELALSKINTIVPVQRTSASRPIKPCDRDLAERMYAPYPERAEAAFAAKWQGENAAERRKDEVLNRINANDSKWGGSLTELTNQAQGFGTIDTIQIRPLLDARSAFNSDLEAFSEFQPDAIVNIGQIGSLQSSDTESYAATIQLIFARWDNIRTWIYLALAIIIDFILIALLTEMIRRYAPSSVRNAQLSEDERELTIKFETDPRFIWRPAVGSNKN